MNDSDRIVIPAETTVAIIVLIVGLMTVNFLPVGGFYGDGVYTMLAKALATGHGYHVLNIPGEPAAVHYPPGYPLLLAVLWKIGPTFPANVILFKLVNVVLLGVIAWATCRYAVHVLLLSPGVAVLGTLLGTITVPILALTTMVLSEPLFLALAIPVLILAEGMVRHRPARREAVLLGILSGAAVLVRSIGIMLPIAVIAVWMTRKHWRAMAWYAGTTLFVLSPWLLWTSLYAGDVPSVLRGSYGSYGGWFVGGLQAGGVRFLLATARTNIHALVVGVTTSFLVQPGDAVVWVTMLLLTFLFSYGVWRARHRAPVTLVFLALYLGLVVVWPDQPLRFAWGLWPVLMVLLLVPVEVAQSSKVPRALRLAVGVAVLLLVPGILRYNVRGFAGKQWESIPRGMTDRAQPTIRWVRQHARRTDVVAAESEPMVYLYTDRRSVPAETFTALQYLRSRTAAQNADELRQIVESGHVRFVLVHSPAEVDAARAMAADTTRLPRLTLTDSTSGTYVFTVGTPPKPAAPPTDSTGV